MSDQIILTTGIYDAIKDHIRRKKVSHNEEVRLTSELRNALQVRRRVLPDDVVTVTRKLTIKDQSQNKEEEYIFVGIKEAKPKKNKHTILSDMALATVGYKVGDVIEWPFRDGEQRIEILKVENWQN